MQLAEWISATIAAARRMPPVSWMLRGFIAMAATIVLLGTTLPAWDAPNVYVAGAIVAAVACVIVPDTIAALLLVALIGVCWLARAPGEVSAGAVVTALGLLGVHVGAALAASFPARATIGKAILRTWGLHGLGLAAFTVVAAGLAALVEAWSPPGSIVVVVVAMGGLAALAWQVANRP
jgi:hypothetical protein